MHAALLPAGGIPIYFFSEGQRKLAEGCGDRLAGDGLEKALAALRKFALIYRETVADERDDSVRTDTMRLHPLVRIVAAERRTTEARNEVMRELTKVMADVYPHDVGDNSQTWPRARRL